MIVPRGHENILGRRMPIQVHGSPAMTSQLNLRRCQIRRDAFLSVHTPKLHGGVLAGRGDDAVIERVKGKVENGASMPADARRVEPRKTTGLWRRKRKMSLKACLKKSLESRKR